MKHAYAYTQSAKLHACKDIQTRTCVNKQTHKYTKFSKRNTFMCIHYKDCLIKNKIQLRFILLNAWTNIWTLLNLERVYIHIVFWTNMNEALVVRQFKILSTHWNKSMIAYMYKILIVFHNIRNKSTFNSKKMYLKLMKILYSKYIPILFQICSVLGKIVVAARHYTR